LPIESSFSPETGQVASWSGFAGAFVEVSALAVDVNAVAASANPAIMMDLTVRLNCFISSILNYFVSLFVHSARPVERRFLVSTPSPAKSRNIFANSLS
jgi:hypothetical protein